jgi:NitT/TauT family transport system substrate-binding protein
MAFPQTRRRLLATMALAGVANLVHVTRSFADGPPETTAIRFYKLPNVCIAPQLIAQELLQAEGFTEISYIDAPAGEISQAIGQNKLALLTTPKVTSMASQRPGIRGMPAQCSRGIQ